MRGTVHDGAAEERGKFSYPPVLPSQDQSDDDGVQEVGEGGVEGPQSLETPSILAMRVQTSSRPGDLGGERRERLFKRSGGVVLTLEIGDELGSCQRGGERTLKGQRDTMTEGQNRMDELARLDSREHFGEEEDGGGEEEEEKKNDDVDVGETSTCPD